MQKSMTAIEMTGTIDRHNQLKLDGFLPFTGPKRVRVIVLSPIDEEIDERMWLRSASQNSAFDFLAEQKEDIYSLTDGKPFHDKI